MKKITTIVVALSIGLLFAGTITYAKIYNPQPTTTDSGNVLKTKKLTGTTDNDTATSVPHGLDASKILSAEAFIKVGTLYFPQNYQVSASPNYFTLYVTGTNIELIDVGVNVDNAPYTILITYEE